MTKIHYNVDTMLASKIILRYFVPLAVKWSSYWIIDVGFSRCPARDIKRKKSTRCLHN